MFAPPWLRIYGHSNISHVILSIINRHDVILYSIRAGVLAIFVRARCGSDLLLYNGGRALGLG